MSGGSYTLTSTIGQPVVGLAAGGTYSNQSGFWNIRTGDTIPPTVSGFALTTPFRSQSTTFNVPITQLNAADLHGVTGYYFGTTSTPPTDAWGAGWNAPTPGVLQLNTKGPQTYYVWARDEAGNISTDIVPASTNTILQYLLNVSLSGGGTSITSSPGAIGCMAVAAGTCSNLFDESTNVTLTGTPNSVSELTTWSGSIGSTSNPVLFTMNSDKTITGNFATVTKPARVVYGKGYDTLTVLLPALTGNSTIQTQAGYAPGSQENLQFNQGYTIKLVGGMNNTWDAQTGFTTLTGTLKISSGKVTVQGIKLKN